MKFLQPPFEHNVYVSVTVCVCVKGKKKGGRREEKRDGEQLPTLRCVGGTICNPSLTEPLWNKSTGSKETRAKSQK